MITDEGKIQFKRYLAGWVPNVARSIAYGVSDNSPDGERLGFEIGRANISITSYDFSSELLIFKATMTTDIQDAYVTELALYSTDVDSVAGQWGSKMITLIRDPEESWTRVGGGTTLFTSGTTRINSSSLQQNPTGTSTQTDQLADVNFDFSGYSGADQFKVAYQSAGTGAPILEVKFLNDDSNYYSFEWTHPSGNNEYLVKDILKSSFSATGTPNWGNISAIQLSSTAPSAATDIQWDGIRIEDRDTINSEYVMVAQQLLETPIIKVAGQEQEMEYAIQIGFL